MEFLIGVVFVALWLNMVMVTHGGWGTTGWSFGRGRAARRERRRAAKEQRRAELAMRIAERRAELLARERLRRVQLQMARGSAGDASPQQAREALRSRGGRANDLDERWF